MTRPVSTVGINNIEDTFSKLLYPRHKTTKADIGCIVDARLVIEETNQVLRLLATI